jgi:hypothetical protein
MKGERMALCFHGVDVHDVTLIVGKAGSDARENGARRRPPATTIHIAKLGNQKLHAWAGCRRFGIAASRLMHADTTA